METFENLNDTTYLADIGCRFKLVNDLIPYARNSRDHSDGQVSKIASSIKEFKFLNPVIIDGDNGIIAGHGRVLAAKKINMTYVPVVDGSHLSELQRRAYVIADNKIALDSTWDDELLKIELKDLKLADFDLDLTGFDLPEIEELFAGDEANEIKEGLIDDDAVPDVDKNEYDVERGDVWVLGQHRLKCGDSTNEDDVADLMQGEKADMVFTDPPYGYEYKSNYQKVKKYDVLKNDDSFLNFLPILKKFMADNSSIFLCTSFQTVAHWITSFQEYLKYKNLIVWKKNNHSMGDLEGAFAGIHELIIFGQKGKVKLLGKRDIDVWEFDRVPPSLHPTMKPVELVKYAISKVPSNLVIDLFLGSGSTLIACEKTNRKCYGMELDEHYCSVIIKRWEEFTGEKAVLQKNDDFSES